MSKTKALLIDGNNRLYAAYFACSNLSFEGLSTACIAGMPSMVRALINDIKPDEVFIVWDGHKNPKKFRQSILPSYKEHRSENTLVDIEDLVRQKKVVQKLFRYMGIKQILNPTLEGDDTLYAVYRRIRKKYSQIIINTGDKDFNQMLSKQVFIFSESRKKMITPKNVKREFGYSANETVDWLSLIGDKSDDIPGLKGCGEKTARSLLDKYGSIANFLDSGDSFPRVNRDELLEIRKRNYKLISLPYFYRKFIRGRKNPKFLFEKRPKIDVKKLHRLSAVHGANRFLDPNFIKPFKILQK